MEDYNHFDLIADFNDLVAKRDAYRDCKSQRRKKTLNEWEDCMDLILSKLYDKIFLTY